MNNACSFAFLTLFLFVFFSMTAVAEESEGPVSVELPEETEWPEQTEPPKDDNPYSGDSSINQEYQAGPPPSSVPVTPNKPDTQSTVTPPSVGTPPASPQPAPNPYYETHPYPPKEPTLMSEPVDETAQKEDDDTFNFFTLAPKVGYLFFPKSSLGLNGYSSTVEARNGVIAKLHFDFGGDGLSFELAPIFAAQAGGIVPLAEGTGLSDSLQKSTLLAIGGEAAVAYRFKAGLFFPSIGLGLHADYLMGTQIDYGTEIYGRIPVGFTVYMGPHVGLTCEIGFMYGFTGIKTPFQIPSELDPIIEDMDPNTLDEFNRADSQEDYEKWYENHQKELQKLIDKNQNKLPDKYADYNPQQLRDDLIKDQLSKSIRFGNGFGMDISIGIRFP